MQPRLKVRPRQTGALLPMWAFFALALSFVAAPISVAGQQPAPRTAYLVRVALPIDERVADEVGQVVRRIAKGAPAALRPDERPILILKFDTDRGQTGAGSRLASAMELAQLLTSEEVVGLKIVAYAPGLLPSVAEGNAQPIASLQGHATLVALAAETIFLSPEVPFGNAAVDAQRRDPLAVDIYRNLASKRLPLPIPIVLSLIDPTETLEVVTTADGEELVSGERLGELEAAGKVIQKETLAAPNQTAAYTADQLKRFSQQVIPVANKSELASQLQVDLSRLEAESLGGKEWRAVQFNLPPFVDNRTVDWGIRAIEQRLKSDSINLLIIKMDETQADLDTALKLSRYLSGFDPERIQTAAYINGNVAGPAALISLSCDHVLMDSQARLGGSFEPALNPNDLQQIEQDLARIAEDKERDIAWFRSMVILDWDPLKFRHALTGQNRWMTRDEQQRLGDAEQWQMQGPVTIIEGFDATFAETEGLARTILNSESELRTYYQLAEAPVELSPTRTDRFFDRLAAFLARPLVSVWLLMGAVFLLSAEMKAPGLGLPGFLGVICLALFFWSHYLDGNAEWFEILLFAIGAVFVALEIFVIPGVGVFGIGGVVMMAVALILATQTFVFPRNAEDYARLPVSLGMVLAASSSFLFALFIFRTYGKDLPYFKKLMLEPPLPNSPQGDDAFGGMADWVGKQGTTVTRLMPSGKAKIAGKVVDVITEGLVIEAKSPIQVIEVSGNRIVVAPREK